MSTDRARALRYSEEVSKRQKQPRRQPNNFGSRPPPPSYRSQDQEKGVRDDRIDDDVSLRQEEKKIEKDESKDVIDSKDFDKPKPTGRVMPTTATTSAMPVVSGELKPAFAKCWITVDDIAVPKKVFSKKSSFVPSFIAFFEILFQMEDILDGNEELRWKSPHYFSLPVRVYYSVICIVQILRAKENSSMTTRSESSWLRAFTRRFSDASCPIAGPLVPILTNVTANLPEDDQFEYVCPTMERKGTYSVAYDKDKKTSVITVNPSHFLIPAPTLIGDILRIFCTSGPPTNENFNENGDYVPFLLSNGGTLGGIQFPPGTTTTSPLGNTFAEILSNPTISKPLPETRHRLKELHSHYQRSAARDFPVLDPILGFDPMGPADFTALGENFSWFETCRSMATTQMQFFSDSTNLSKIPVVGGQSVVGQAELFFQTQKKNPTGISEWYPDHYRSIKAKFRSTTATFELDHVYQCAYSLTNAKIQWTDSNGNKIGTRASGMKTGPYWDNKKHNYELETKVDVCKQGHIMIQTQFYESHGI